MATKRPAALPSDLGQTRTIMAADRTLMAWIRTALSMASFGFTIYKALQAVQKSAGLEDSSPRQVGLVLTGLAVTALVLGTYSYWTTLKDLQQVEEFRLGRPVLIMALVMTLLSVGAFVAILTRLT